VSGSWFGQLSPEGDVDYIRVQLTASSSTLVVDTFNLGDGAECIRDDDWPRDHRVEPALRCAGRNGSA